MIRVVGLTKTHRGSATATLDDVSFTVETGAIIAILGRSGAGKSTLLSCLAGLCSFDAGTVEAGSARVSGGGDPTPLLGHVGLVFQTLELFPHLDVVENLVLAPVRAHAQPRAQAVARARTLLAQLELEDKERASVPALSGGQRQRVAIARALMLEPAVLLYDEPTSALDPALKNEVKRALLRTRDQTRAAQVIVTHDAAFAADVADRVYTLEAGRLLG